MLAFAFLLSVVTYRDRVCIAAAAPFIMRDLGLSVLQMSVVFSAFTLAYSLFEVPSGWLADVRGARRVLTRIVLWWSSFTILTGAARGFASLTATRFLFGAGEAGAFPSMARAFSRWFPSRERGQANGVLFFGSRIGGLLAAPLALLLVRHWGWRASFVAFGAVGVVWAIAWRRWYRDDPAEHPAVGAAELAWIRGDVALERGASACAPGTLSEVDAWRPARTGNARRYLANRNMAAICAMYFAFGYGLYFYFTWLPTYLIDVLGFSAIGGGLWAAMPFALAAVADLAGGRATDRLARTRGLRAARCGLGAASFAASALLVAGSTVAAAPVIKALLLALALGAADFALGACWAVCLDVGAARAGVVTGVMNTFGNLGGLIGPLVIGVAVQRWGSWTFPFYVTAAVYAAGAAAWLAIDPETPLGSRG